MRPEFHFTASGWINDPHGVTYADGRYHLFFQYVPGSTSWDLGCYWGHASGHDLFSLHELAPALAPGDGDDGIWSGAVMVADDGLPRIFYTSISAGEPAIGRIRIAYAEDPDWLHWKKGPVVATAPTGTGVTAFRDPVVTADGSGWRMLVGAGFANGAAGAVGYSSGDGETWSEGSTVIARLGDEVDPVWSGSIWECPQIIEVDGQHALLLSVWNEDVLHDVLYALGSYEEGVFSPRTWGRLSFGPSPYAATAFRDQQDRSCVMFWLRGISGDGWTGAHSVPYVVAIDGDQLSLSPHPDLDRYHDETAVTGTAADMSWSDHARTTMRILGRDTEILVLDKIGTDLHIRVDGAEYTLPWEGDIRIILDGPILEVSSRAGVFACPIDPLQGDWHLEGADIKVRGLRKQ
ncbi:glycoside hydrolase family 32 protein [Marisediminicola senii]|uniref:glycoside hydrolase family 32 protein n=1 Tax=Marisediminicola senii TaxID=2711233 RepID=UPI0013E9D246|nr:glycoside hydrolase family 32 protein [Marisediminicola senii]